MATSRVNVKIPTQRLIDALTESKTKFDKTIKDFEKKAEKVKESQKARKEAAFAYGRDPKNIEKAKVELLSWSGLTARIEMKVPESALPKLVEFERGEENEYHQAVEAVRAIENSIRILRLTSDEFVSTSTYNSVAKYL